MKDILHFVTESSSEENKVFLGGTCNDSKWREELIPMLKIPYFNPVVEDWTPECQAEEEQQKKICAWQLYVITPQMTGVFSIAEAVQGSNKDPKHTIFCVLQEHQDKTFEKFNVKSLAATSKMIKENGAIVCDNLNEVAKVLNNSKQKIKLQIRKYKDGFALFEKYHWYNKWCKSSLGYFNNAYWLKFNDIVIYLQEYLSKEYGGFIIVQGKTELDNIYKI